MNVFGSRAPSLAIALNACTCSCAIEAKRRRGFLRIGAGVDCLFAVIAVLGLLFALGFGFRLDDFKLGRVLRLSDDVGRVRIDEADDDVDEPRLAGLDRLVGSQQEVVRRRIHRKRAADRLEAFLDALGNADLAFARQELNRAHLAHVHAHRIGGAAEFGVERGKCGRRLFDRLFIRRCRGLRGEQGLRVRCLLVHRDAHVVNRVDDILDLFGIDDFGGQVVIDLRVGEVALFLAARDQQLQLRLALLRHDRTAALDAEHLLLDRRLRHRLWRRSLCVDFDSARLARSSGRRMCFWLLRSAAALARSFSRTGRGFFGAAALTDLRSSGNAFLAGGNWGFCLRVMIDQTNSSVFPYVCARCGGTRGAKAKPAIVFDGASNCQPRINPGRLPAGRFVVSL